MASQHNDHDAPPSLRVPTRRLWDGRLFYAGVAGAFVGLGLGALILSFLQWTGDKAPALVGVCILLTAGLTAMLCMRAPRIRAIHAGPTGLLLEGRDGSETRVPFDDLRLCVPYVESLFTLIPGKSFAVDLLIGERFLRLYISAPLRGELYRFIEKHAPKAAINTPGGALELPMPPDAYRSGWQRDNERLVRSLFRHFRLHAFIAACLSSVAFAGLVLVQVLAAVAIGEEAIHGMLILFIVVSGVLAGGAWWGVWCSIADCRRFLGELQRFDGLDGSDVEVNAGRLRLMIETGPPEEISTGTKCASVFSVLLGCVPLVGLILAIRALYCTWERDSWWNSIAWLGLILGCVLNFCYGFVAVMEIMGEPTLFDDF